jgi:glycosyltransferase involved in cell wall biosynthesis
MAPLLSVVIPVFNERKTLPITLTRVARTPFNKEVVVVDDGSWDGTREYLKRLERGRARLPRLRSKDLKIILHRKNQGKGRALRSGFALARGQFVLIQDADLEYDPADYPALLKPLLDGHADVVYGTRLAGGAAHRVLFFWHAAGNALLTLFSNMLTNLNLTDMETGYKVFRRDLLRRFTLSSARFGVEPELTAKFARLGCRIYEVPINYHGRTYDQGKKITWRDGMAALFHIMRYRFFD